MKRLIFLPALLLFLVSAFAASGFAQSFGKEQIIKAAPYLEANPFSKEAPTIRALAVKYVIETDEVNVIVCGGDLMAPILDKKNKNSSELTAQYTIAMAAFKLTHPENKDENDAQVAGLESALRAYEKMISEKPKTRHDGMDRLLKMRDNGELAAASAARNCGKK